MTVPAIMDATQVPAAGALALVAGIAAAWFGAGLFGTAATCCLIVLIAELLLI